MILVERDRELGALTDLLAECIDGRGAVALISGPLASGKTELLHRFVETAVDSEALLATATCSSSERSLALGVVNQLLRSASPSSGHRDNAGGPRGDASSELPRWAEQKPRADEHARMIDTIGSELLDLAAAAPLVVAVDDVHDADAPSRQCLRYLIRRVQRQRVLVVLTELTGPRPADPLLHADFRRQPRRHHFRLTPISRRGVRSLLERRLATTPSPDVVDAFHTISGGNPRMLGALLEDLRTHADTTPASGSAERVLAGPAYSDAVLACIYGAGTQTLSIVRALAVLGELATPPRIGRLLGYGVDTVSAALEVLTTAGLLGSGRFRHPVARSAVLGDLPSDHRMTLHRRAARVLHEDAVAAETVAMHLLAAGRVDGPQELAMLRDAIESALVQGQTSLAITCMNHAFNGPPSDGRLDLTALLFRVEWWSDAETAGRYTHWLATALREGRLRNRGALIATWILLMTGHAHDAEQALDRLEHAPETDMPPAAALHEFRLWMFYTYPGLMSRFPKTLGTPDALRACTTPACEGVQMSAAALLHEVLTRGGDDDDVRLALNVLEAQRGSTTTLERLDAPLAPLTYADCLDTAAVWCQGLLDEATARQDQARETWLNAISAQIAVRRGDLQTAVDRARRALAGQPSRTWHFAIACPRTALLLALTGMGRHEEAERQLGQEWPAAVLRSRMWPAYLHARGHHYLATHRIDAALGDFHRCGELMRAWDIDQPALAPWRTDAAQVHIRRGERDGARRLATGQIELAGSSAPRVRGTSLRVLAAASDVPRRPALLREAVDLLERCGARLELAKTLVDLTHTYYKLGQPAKARKLARRAAAVAADCRAEPLLRTLHPAQPRTTADAHTEHPGRSALSAAERRVAVLAARGHTNREIAGMLYITVSTVEQHLTRVYRKLDVRRRAGLPPPAELENGQQQDAADSLG